MATNAQALAAKAVRVPVWKLLFVYDDSNDATKSLLRIADPQDSAAWAEFTDLYEPILIRVAKSRGLQIGDARS